MSRPSRSERMASKGRPKRRAARTHFFKYQLANNPSRAEEIDLRRALQESLREQVATANKKGSNINKTIIISSTNSSDVSRSNHDSSSSSNESIKRTRSNTSVVNNSLHLVTTPVNKRAKLSVTHGLLHHPHQQQSNKCEKNGNLESSATQTLPQINNFNKAIKTYSRNQSTNINSNDNDTQRQKPQLVDSLKSSTPIIKPSVASSIDLSKKKNQNQVNVKVNKKRLPQGSWSPLGVPEEKVIYLRDDEPPKRLICYPAIKHVEGDVIQVRDSLLLRSGGKKTDLPYIAKVCAFWKDAETGGVMMSLFWYYRPEHTEEGRKPHQLPDEIFASRHRDVDSVECIEDKCYVLTFNEYCRYKKRCKMEQVNTTWSLTDVTIPVSNESYPRRNRIPESDVNPELVFCCRQIYDSRMKRLVKNPLINTKYGHI